MARIMEYVTYWGPSINDWTNGSDKRFAIEREESDYEKGIVHGGRKMTKISLDDILTPGVTTGVDMENGYLPLVLYANEDLILEVANCDAAQGGWHRNMGADEWVFQYKGGRTIRSECGDIELNEGDMSVIPRGIAHKNDGHGPNIELTIYSKKPLGRFAPTDPEVARQRMKIKNSQPVMPPVELKDAIFD